MGLEPRGTWSWQPEWKGQRGELLVWEVLFQEIRFNTLARTPGDGGPRVNSECQDCCCRGWRKGLKDSEMVTSSEYTTCSQKIHQMVMFHKNPCRPEDTGFSTVRRKVLVRWNHYHYDVQRWVSYKGEVRADRKSHSELGSLRAMAMIGLVGDGGQLAARTCQKLGGHNDCNMQWD